MQNRVFATLGVFAICLAACSASFAEDEGSKAPTSQPSLVSLSDKEAMQSSVGKAIAVQGVVSDAQWSPSGAVFLINFTDGQATQFQCVIFRKLHDDMEKAFSGDLSNAFEGSNVRIEGKLQMYHQHPQIIINDANQVSILTKGPGNSPHAGAFNKPHVLGVYGNLNVTDEQREKIAAIQKESHDAELAYEKKLREEQDEKIAALLTDEQKQQLKSLQDAAARRSQNGGDAD
jgi:Spy/CpxP family protein refolding chaperone